VQSITSWYDTATGHLVAYRVLPTQLLTADREQASIEARGQAIAEHLAEGSLTWSTADPF
jgi:hypothetical protein